MSNTDPKPAVAKPSDDLILDAVGRAAVEKCKVLGEDSRSHILHTSAQPWDGSTSWTRWLGGKYDTKNGLEVTAPWGDFVATLKNHALGIVGKGEGLWFSPALTKNGGCRDQDMLAITQLSFDCDGVGEWNALRAALESAGITYAIQRSSSHRPEVPKWHIHIPLAERWSGSKREWRFIMRHTLAWFSVLAELECKLDASPPAYGFDTKTDRLVQPWFPSARRTSEQEAPETVGFDGEKALDLKEFLARSGFDLVAAEAAARAKMPPRRQRSKRCCPPRPVGECPADASLLVLAFRAAGMAGLDLSEGKVSVQCPWEGDHTAGERFDSSTVLFPPTPGSDVGAFLCSHAHCEKRKLADVLGALPKDALAEAQRAIDERRASESRVGEVGGGGAAVPGEGGVGTPGSNVGRFALTDLGNGERLASSHGRELRYCYATRTWLAWTGTRWVKDMTGDVHRCAKATVRGIYNEAASCESEHERKETADHAKRSEKVERLEAMISLARFERGVAVAGDQLDREPMVLNVQNGTLDLSSGTRWPHDPEDLITKLAPVDFAPEATCPRWESFVGQIFAENASLIDFVQRVVGYSLTGSVAEQVLFFLHGTGSNGKTTFLKTLQDLLGDYAMQGAPDLLLSKKGDSHPTDQADLMGARFVVCTEIEAGRFLAEATMKRLTGGDKVKARFMGKDFFEFEPTFKLFLAANHKPLIRQQDEGVWRRIRLIPFNVTIPAGDRDSSLPEKLRAEFSGILNWALEGLREYERIGLSPPKEVEDATGDYKAEMDPLADFLADCCEVSPNVKAAASEIFAAYEAWSRRNGSETLSARSLGMGLREKGFGSKKSNGSSVWQGVRIKTTVGR
jgi:putative DNA primase/helicase